MNLRMDADAHRLAADGETLITHVALQPWRIGRDRALSLDQPRLMGILNITPDSFSDGGAYAGVDDAVAGALRMIREGAAIIDVGGESTRPGAANVDEDEQIRRTVPVIETLREREAASGAAILISIDTTRASVAEAALDAGADIINDVSAGMDDPGMLPLAVSRGCGIILMHRLRRPAEDSFSTQYPREPDYRGDVYSVVRDFLQQRMSAALDAGVRREAIVIDPGLGFGKSVAQNYELAARLGELQRDLDLPALSAASRKSFLAQPPGATVADPPPPPRERLAAGIALTLSHWQGGVRLFRVHDVLAHAQALTAAAALQRRQGQEQIRPHPG
jgi:dihydropteroate synthase